MKESTCQNVRMEAYCSEVQKLEEQFDGIKLHHVLQRDNEEADALVKLASSWKDPPSGVFLHVLDTPSIWLEGGPGVAFRGSTPGVILADGELPPHEGCMLAIHHTWPEGNQAIS